MAGSLLDSYLRAVRGYLPKGAAKDDVLSELAECLRTRLDARAAELRRPLTEREQARILTDFGGPIEVATRYGASGRGLAFGRQLIGPEIFRLYIRIFVFQLGLTLAVHAVYALSGRPLSARTLLWSVLAQFVLLTIVYAGIDALQRRRPGSRAERAQAWSFPPLYLQDIPRWQSLSGFSVLAVAGLWWSVLPWAPALLLGSATDRLVLGPGFLDVYWPVLFLLGAGIAQRIATYVRPDWNWLQAITRLVINTCLVTTVILHRVPYVTALDPFDPAMTQLAARVNTAMRWNVGTGLGLYWLITAAFHAWLCASIGRYAMRVMRDKQSPANAPLPPQRSGADNLRAFKRRAS